MALKGYLPPEGPQNVHGVPHNYIEGQGTHRVGDTVVHSPEEVILTADPDAQAEIEAQDLESVPSYVAQDALEAFQDDEAQAASIIEEYQQDSEEAQEDAAEEDPDSGETEQVEGEDGPAIPSDLDEVPYRGEDTMTLQHLAQSYGIAANQSAEALREALREERGS